MPKKRLGEVLCERGHIGAADLKRALQEQQGKAIHLGELLLQRKLVSKKDLAAALAEVSSVEYVDCQKLQPATETLGLIPQALAKRCRAIPKFAPAARFATARQASALESSSSGFRRRAQAKPSKRICR